MAAKTDLGLCAPGSVLHKKHSTNLPSQEAYQPVIPSTLIPLVSSGSSVLSLSKEACRRKLIEGNLPFDCFALRVNGFYLNTVRLIGPVGSELVEGS
jgi:hypothetical protein